MSEVQPSLFDRPYPANLYDGNPPHERVSTSTAAALSMKPVAGKLQQRVLQAITEAQHGLTDDELEVRLGLKHQTVSARRRELYLLGHIVSIGTRKTRSGRKAQVWICRPVERT